MSKKHEEQDIVSEQLTNAEVFIEKYKKELTYVVGGIAVLVLAFFGYQKYILGPKEKEAERQMYVAVKYFEKDSLDKALNGDGTYPGLRELADEYGSTKAGNLTQYYLGMSELRMGNFEEAIDALKSFDSDDQIVKAMALGGIGDAYAELGNMDKAASFYKKAGTHSKNEFTSPLYLMRYCLVAELNGDYKDAIKVLESIKKDFPKSGEARDVDMVKARIEAKRDNG